MATPTNDDLVGNMVTVLCTAAAFAPRGCCNVQIDAAVTRDQLQTLLTAAFPANGWADDTQMDAILARALRYGVVIRITSATTEVYLLNLDMVNVSIRNDQFRTLCDGILPVRDTPFNFPFRFQ